MNSNLFKIALEQLQPSDWGCFEALCTQFLIPEFGSLRTMAGPSGDSGRDAELFAPDGKPLIVFQYSVSGDWRTKIRHTVRRVRQEFPSVHLLVYMTNQHVGGRADDLRREFTAEGFVIDIRDRGWFLERATSDTERSAAAEALIDRIARPFLESERVIEKRTSPLTSAEARAAILYLGLQLQDDEADKGLTKLCFDALVRAALRQTHSEARLTRSKVHEAVLSALPCADPATVKQQTDNALARLTKRYVRYWREADEFCLSRDEHTRIVSRLADCAVEDADFAETVRSHCALCLSEVSGHGSGDIEDLTRRVPRVLEKLLLQQGEEFVTAVLTGNLRRVGLKQLRDIILDDIGTTRPLSANVGLYPDLVGGVIRSLLSEASTSTLKYLSRLANSYTLFTFLNHTPDVRAATRKLLAHGTVWVDTTVLLPIIAERVESDSVTWRLNNALASCGEVGIEWRVTSGVIQEINAHMNNALACSQYQSGRWRGRVPYLYQKFMSTGCASSDFRGWLELFRGTDRPDDDIAQFLNEALGIKREDLGDVTSKVSAEVYQAVDRFWTEAHEQRRRNSQVPDDLTTRILIRHDIETFLGVMSLRESEQVSDLGYRHWLLTLDRNAWSIHDRLKAEFHKEAPPSPLMSLSYLLGTLAFGAHRRVAGKEMEPAVPLILDIEMSESMPFDIVELANRVRRENANSPEYVIRRKVRDAVDGARRRWVTRGQVPLCDEGFAE